MTNHLFDQIKAAMPTASARFIELADGRVLTYGDMLERSGGLAATLVSLGVEPGDRVAVQVEKSASAIFLYLACVRAGAVFLPLNTAYTEAEVGYFLGDAEPKLFVCDPSRLTPMTAVASAAGVAAIETLDEHGVGTLTDKAAVQSSQFEDVPRGADDLAAILYTSGTTGRSKGAMLSHENLASNARVLVAYWRFSKGRRAAACASDLPHAWPLRCDQCDPDGRRIDAVPRTIRP